MRASQCGFDGAKKQETHLLISRQLSCPPHRLVERSNKVAKPQSAERHHVRNVSTRWKGFNQ